MFRRQARKVVIELRDEKHIDPCTPHELDLLLERTDQPRRAIRREKVDRMGRESHGNGLHAKVSRAFYDSFQDFAMAEMQAIKVADAHHSWMRDIRIGQ
jgi:hypothetical protein